MSDYTLVELRAIELWKADLHRRKRLPMIAKRLTEPLRTRGGVLDPMGYLMIQAAAEVGADKENTE